MIISILNAHWRWQKDWIIMAEIISMSNATDMGESLTFFLNKNLVMIQSCRKSRAMRKSLRNNPKPLFVRLRPNGQNWIDRWWNKNFLEFDLYVESMIDIEMV